MARRLTVLSIAACLFGVLSAAPSTAPMARADQLPIGYNVTCTASGSTASCQVSGCPRVKDDLAGDVIHARFNAQPQQQIGKGCNDTINVSTGLMEQTVDAAAGFTFSLQGCRTHMASSDDCGAWSVYKYTAPAPAPAAKQNPVRCTGSGPDSGKTLPPGSTCAAAPAQAAPVKCPPGSLTATVPAGQQCGAPTNAIAVNISRNGLNARLAITNNSSLPATCSYAATKSGGFGPQEVDRSIDVGANSTGAITDMLWPPLGTSYNAKVTCTVTYNGKQTPIGHTSQNVSG